MRMIARSSFALGLAAAIALGVVTLLITHVMGSFAPWSFANWTVDRLPGCARLWVELYGEQIVLASFPGSKLYLLLQKGLATAGVPARRSMRQALLPLSFHISQASTVPASVRLCRFLSRMSCWPLPRRCRSSPDLRVMDDRLGGLCRHQL